MTCSLISALCCCLCRSSRISSRSRKLRTAADIQANARHEKEARRELFSPVKKSSTKSSAGRAATGKKKKNKFIEEEAEVVREVFVWWQLPGVLAIADC